MKVEQLLIIGSVCGAIITIYKLYRILKQAIVERELQAGDIKKIKEEQIDLRKKQQDLENNQRLQTSESKEEWHKINVSLERLNEDIKILTKSHDDTNSEFKMLIHELLNRKD